jgi:CBS domain-containing membrane protein
MDWNIVSENRLVGMVYQANLIAALYNESHDHVKNQPLFV